MTIETAFNNSRHYWLPQLNDPLLSSFPRVFLDAVGFGQSRSGGQPWSFDLTAQAILVILDELQGEGVIDGNAVIIGDSMGGGPTGLRAALKSAERESHGDRVAAKILGVVACGTSAEEESAGLSADCVPSKGCLLTPPLPERYFHQISWKSTPKQRRTLPNSVLILPSARSRPSPNFLLTCAMRDTLLPIHRSTPLPTLTDKRLSRTVSNLLSPMRKEI